MSKSESGKTTLVKGSLITKLKQRGYKMAVTKHAGEVQTLSFDNPEEVNWKRSEFGDIISVIKHRGIRNFASKAVEAKIISR